jgi:anti-anti-sigma regulatory factor
MFVKWSATVQGKLLKGCYGYVHHIVLDCSSICFIDTVGAKIINQVHIIYVVPDLPIGLTG